MHLKMLSTKWQPFCPGGGALTHWGRVTYICVSKLTIIGSDNGLSPGRRQTIIWTNAWTLLIGPFSEISIEILTFSFMKMRLNVSSAKCRPSCLGLNVLTNETGIVRDNYADAIAAYDPGVYSVMSSATMLSTIQDKVVLVFREQGS